MGMVNPAWFQQLVCNARELFLVDEQIGEPHSPVIPAPSGAGISADNPVLVVWASQTGAAETFADELISLLHTHDLSAVDTPFDTLELAALESASQALFIVSTTCDGDPPDMAEEFSDTIMQRPANLSRLRYGLLALGDRCYEDFCGFGHQLHDWLQASHAQAWFEPVEVDDEDPSALDCWRERVGALLIPAAD